MPKSKWDKITGRICDIVLVLGGIVLFFIVLCLFLMIMGVEMHPVWMTHARMF